MRAIGLLHLTTKYRLRVPPPLTRSYIHRGATRTDQVGEVKTQYFTEQYDPGVDDRYHLEFALKWEQWDLRVLGSLFRQAAIGPEVAALVREKPTGEYARRLWYLYEWLTGSLLPLEAGVPRNYVPLLDEAVYVVSTSPTRSRRHHIENNLGGTPLLCPLVRRTQKVDDLLAFDFPGAIANSVPDVDKELLTRAVSFLYLRETRSSFQIEGEDLPDRNERFVAQLEEVTNATVVTHQNLIEWQSVLVDPRYARGHYRDDQVYVAEGSRIGRRSKIHYIAPRPPDVSVLMDAFLELDRALEGTPPLVHAAIWSFVFVFIHPFDDGNGRLHRLLIHNVLKRRGLTPDNIVLPVSAVIVGDRLQYDRALESFSKPLMAALDGRYELAEDELMTVTDDTRDLYRSFDATPLVEGLGQWARKAIEQELVDEIAWLRRYDVTREAVRRIVDMPDKKLRNFIAIVESNSGRLSARKRGQFSELTDDEVHSMERAIQEHLLQMSTRV